MGFDITFLKPTEQELVPNSFWVKQFLEACPQFSEVECDYRKLAEDLGSDIGMSPAEYSSRGIGVQLQGPEADGWWTILSFWDSYVTLTLPNFSGRSIPEAIAAISPIRSFFRAAGFALADPNSGEPITREEEDRVLLEGYSRRQGVVAHVARLTGGKAPGASPK